MSCWSVIEVQTSLSDLNEYHARRACRLVDVQGARVLVVGANSGTDCRYFVEKGAREVHGVDVVPTVGRDYRASKTSYVRMSVEHMGLSNDRYDLVYCFATLEHVPDVGAALHEMVRVTRPGGVIYSVASPLWNSRNGHHMACLSQFPWIHLRMGRAAMIAHCKANGVASERGIPIEHIVSYVMDSGEFNRRPARDYVEAGAGIPDVAIVTNRILKEPNSVMRGEWKGDVKTMGIPYSELSGIAHEFVAIKRPFAVRHAIRPLAYWSRDKVGSVFRRSRGFFSMKAWTSRTEPVPWE